MLFLLLENGDITPIKEGSCRFIGSPQSTGFAVAVLILLRLDGDLPDWRLLLSAQCRLDYVCCFGYSQFNYFYCPN